MKSTADMTNGEFDEACIALENEFLKALSQYFGEVQDFHITATAMSGIIGAVALSAGLTEDDFDQMLSCFKADFEEMRVTAIENNFRMEGHTVQ